MAKDLRLASFRAAVQLRSEAAVIARYLKNTAERQQVLENGARLGKMLDQIAENVVVSGREKA